MAVVAAVATACPPDEPPSPYACAADPVSLGTAYQAVAVSDDGDVVVLLEIVEGDPLPFRYVVVDRTAGTRKLLATAAQGSDGVDVFLHPSGGRALLHRFEPVAPGDHPWSIVDLTTGSVDPLDLPGSPAEVFAVARDLDAVLVDDDIADLEFGPLRRIDLTTGASTPQEMTLGPSEGIVAFDASLTMAATASPAHTTPLSRRIVDVATGAVVHDLSIDPDPVGFGVEVRFTGDDTVLVSNGAPAGSPPDGVVNDSAFVLSLASDEVRRVDPGVADTWTTWASADGGRSVFVDWRNGGELWLRREGHPHRRLPGAWHALANGSVDTVVTTVAGEAFVTCV